MLILMNEKDKLAAFINYIIRPEYNTNLKIIQSRFITSNNAYLIVSSNPLCHHAQRAIDLFSRRLAIFVGYYIYH